mmetsp:Transcript_24276/g.52860  ORF Transcript_24276/g.52860 Transcript_24276/m.52860 type:complete len:235 (-) Transcript_24276:1127-1831(-)
MKICPGSAVLWDHCTEQLCILLALRQGRPGLAQRPYRLRDNQPYCRDSAKEELVVVLELPLLILFHGRGINAHPCLHALRTRMSSFLLLTRSHHNTFFQVLDLTKMVWHTQTLQHDLVVLVRADGDWLPQWEEVHHLASQGRILVHVQQIRHIFVDSNCLSQVLLCQTHLLENLLSFCLNQFGFGQLLPVRFRHLLEQALSFLQIIMESLHCSIASPLCSGVGQHFCQPRNFSL